MKPTKNLVAAGIMLLAPGGQMFAQDSGVTDAMIAEGAPPALARCMVEQLGDDAERLFTASDDELSDADTNKLTTALEACSDLDEGE